MSSSATVRLAREFGDLKSKPKSNYFQVYGLKDECLHHWIVYIIGPPNTPYHGGIFRVLMRFPETYPIDPPSVQFETTMFHPNVYRDGKVCISTLQNPPRGCDGSGEYWRPVLGAEQALLSVVSLLSDPNCMDPANQAASVEYRKSRDLFNLKCQKIAAQSREDLPSDFVMPVVCSIGPTTSSSTTNTTSRNFSRGGDDDDVNDNDDQGEEEEEEEEYVYSDDDEDEDEKTSFTFRTNTTKSPPGELESELISVGGDEQQVLEDSGNGNKSDGDDDNETNTEKTRKRSLTDLCFVASNKKANQANNRINNL